MTRAEQREKRMAEIMDAGLDLFIRKGYAGTKISDIAEAVGMSVGLLFHYFESKEKLYEELIKIGVTGPQSIMGWADLPPLQFFEVSAEGILQAIKAEPFVAKMFVLMMQAQYHDDAPEAVKQMIGGMDAITPTIQKIIQGQQEGTIRAGDSVALAVAFWGAIDGIAEQIALEPDTPCPDSTWVVDIVRRNGETE